MSGIESSLAVQITIRNRESLLKLKLEVGNPAVLVRCWRCFDGSEGLSLAESSEIGEAIFVGGFGIFFLPGLEKGRSELVLDAGVLL